MKRWIHAATDISQYEDMGFDDYQLAQIEEGLESGVDVSLYADPKFDYWQMNQIRCGLESGVDASIYADPKFDGNQMFEIRCGLKSGVDASLYADPKFDSNQMFEIRLGLESGLDVSVYADPKLDWKQMYEIRRSLESELDVDVDVEVDADVSQLDKPKKSGSWKSLIAAINSEAEDGIDSFYEQTEAGVTLEEICQQIDLKLNLFLEPSIQAGTGGIFIYDEKTNEEVGYVDYQAYNDTVLDMAVASKTKSTFQKSYKAYLESLIS